jgi:hypothetical protein
MYGDNQYGTLNDVWKFQKSTAYWILAHGNSGQGSVNYGVINVASINNRPLGRSTFAASWNLSEQFILFSGLCETAYCDDV